ncbi:Inositol-pentakisphosphate 2-kinase [Lachnellula cervina]|uniref:Inositol-pentakisphosphate 2-kinase n=1 Tax=Lachnellula cervina TaxID=1316786 RepID=A0A7D8Z817_9HELO|nr:Inositol-pentakisphosphate 2-kinase [Lachnellula cervina]
MARVPALPQNTELTYLAEGAANIVYRISIRPLTPEPTLLEQYGTGTPPPTEIEPEDEIECLNEQPLFNSKLLRLRKNLPTTFPVAIAQEKWEQLVAPLFSPDQIVEQSLVDIRAGKFIASLNQELRNNKAGADGSSRPTNRLGIYLADDDYGLLVTDMTNFDSAAGEEVHEFKPKWLLQSPSAPKDAVRCRQCARSAQENVKRRGNGKPYKQYLCPLDAVSDDPRGIAQAASLMGTSEGNRRRIKRWLEKSTLLKRLRQLQAELDPIGVLTHDPSNLKSCVAMTLRDCTLFLRLPPNEAGDALIEARLGDLDVKSPDKAPYWKQTELELINDGFYHGEMDYRLIVR